MATPSPARPRVVFMGSGPVAAESLERLLVWCDIEAVITKPQPPHHKAAFPVISVAQAAGLPLLYVTRRRELDELITTQSFDSRAAILIDFGIIVSQPVIDFFPLGIINSHFSLLPEWRGADPISFSILSGQPETGVSLMLLVAAMDEGPILAQGVEPIEPDETTPTLTAKLIKLSDGLLQSTVPAYLQGLPHPETGAPILAADQLEAARLTGRSAAPTYSRKLSKADSLLDFTKPAVDLELEIRAFIEWPKSRTTIANTSVIVTAAHVIDFDPNTDSSGHHKPGAIITLPDKTIGVLATDGVLVIDRLKPSGKNEMTSQAFLAGHSI